MASEPGLPRDLVIEPSSGLEDVLEEGSRRVTALLKAGVPLSLLLDLAEPYGPDSATLYATESRAGD